MQTELTKKDFESDQLVRWCPGCGDYMILAIIQKVFAQLNRRKEDLVVISGIGCSSRLPYYMDTYGIHSIHGRAAAVATGLKLANPKLNTWVVTGDGDSLAIGGNHFIHAARRNTDMNVVIFNNRIYGMTKGQTSPTTPEGLKTKTSPEGSYEKPFNIGELAIGAGVTFFARVSDKDPKLLEDVMMQANAHKGTSVIEVLQNCVIFTDGIHEEITGRETKDNNQVLLEHGKPMIYGKDQKFGLKLNGLRVTKVPVYVDDDINDILVHDPTSEETQLHIALAKMQIPDFPVAMGVIRKHETTTFDEKVHAAIAQAEQNRSYKSIQNLFESGNTWEIK
ncbi:MAG: 2-oxoacid:ferredoxin oxidoreductase subunit beta [Balneolaceae bacterium]